MRVATLVAGCVIVLAGCLHRFPGHGPDDYRTMSCDELIDRLAAFDEKVKQAKAQHAQSAQRQRAVRSRLRETSDTLVREIGRRCPAMVEPRMIL